MAYMPQTKDESELKSLTVAKVRVEYLKLAESYNKIIDGDLQRCPVCGDFLSTKTGFYTDKRFYNGFFPKCKKCILEQVEQRNKKNDKPNETKASVQAMLQEMDLPYIDSLYEAQCKVVNDAVGEKNRSSPFLAYLVPIKSLPQYIGKKWADSEFAIDDDANPDYEQKEIKKVIKSGRKRFGNYPNEDLMFLENQYQDWITRYECNTKTQEEIFERLSFKKWEINKATKSGQSTKDLDKTYQELMTTANIAPRQTSMDAMSDAQTFGTLIQKYEETRPLPEIDPELEDVDKIGLYIDSFYRGHMSKMLGLKNRFSNIYERVMEKFTVKPPEYDEETDSEILFEKIFGSMED